jgi:hypothetical protein
MKDLQIEQMEILLGEMKSCKRENPKAKVVYDLERNEILITYPLPIDFNKFRKHNNKLANELGMEY